LAIVINSKKACSYSLSNVIAPIANESSEAISNTVYTNVGLLYARIERKRPAAVIPKWDISLKKRIECSIWDNSVAEESAYLKNIMAG
jgi:hypothetical protein